MTTVAPLLRHPSFNQEGKSWKQHLHLLRSTCKFKAWVGFITNICWTLLCAPRYLVREQYFGSIVWVHYFHSVTQNTHSVFLHWAPIRHRQCCVCRGGLESEIVTAFVLIKLTVQWEKCVLGSGHLCGVDCVRYWEAGRRAVGCVAGLRSHHRHFSHMLLAVCKSSLKDFLFMSSTSSMYNFFPDMYSGSFSRVWGACVSSHCVGCLFAPSGCLNNGQDGLGLILHPFVNFAFCFLCF